MKARCVKFLRFFLPVLFVLYMGGIISFTHVHIINGVTIVHSHPYHNYPDGAEHEHSGTELQLLHQLSTIYQAGSSLFDYCIQPYHTYKTELICQPAPYKYICKPDKAVQLRAPPAIA